MLAVSASDPELLAPLTPNVPETEPLPVLLEASSERLLYKCQAKENKQTMKKGFRGLNQTISNTISKRKTDVDENKEIRILIPQLQLLKLTVYAGF